jgi:hypothetical protein
MSKYVPLVEIVDVMATEFTFGKLTMSMGQTNTCHLGDAVKEWAWPKFSHWVDIENQSPTLQV